MILLPKHGETKKKTPAVYRSFDNDYKNGTIGNLRNGLMFAITKNINVLEVDFRISHANILVNNL